MPREKVKKNGERRHTFHCPNCNARMMIDYHSSTPLWIKTGGMMRRYRYCPCGYETYTYEIRRASLFALINVGDLVKKGLRILDGIEIKDLIPKHAIRQLSERTEECQKSMKPTSPESSIIKDENSSRV